MKIRLLIVDDHAVVRMGLRMLLDGEPDFDIVGEVESASEAMNSIARLNPHVVLMDIGLPDLSGIDATREVKRIYPDTAIIALTIHESEEYFFKMLEAGASGYLPKRAAPEELMTAIADRGAGNYYFLETPDSFARMFQKEFSYFLISM